MSEFPVSSELVEVVDRALAQDEKANYKYLSAAVRIKLIQIRNHFDVSSALIKIDPDAPKLGPHDHSGHEAPGDVTLVLSDRAMVPTVSLDMFRAAVVPVLEDATTGKITFQGYKRSGGWLNLNFSGLCPIHKRYHDGQAWKWQIKQKLNGEYAGYKCWRDNSFFKISSIPMLVEQKYLKD